MCLMRAWSGYPVGNARWQSGQLRDSASSHSIHNYRGGRREMRLGGSRRREKMKKENKQKKKKDKEKKNKRREAR